MVCSSRIRATLGMSTNQHRNQTLHLLLSWARCDSPFQDSVDETVKLPCKIYRNAWGGCERDGPWAREEVKRMVFRLEACGIHLEMG